MKTRKGYRAMFWAIIITLLITTVIYICDSRFCNNNLEQADNSFHVDSENSTGSLEAQNIVKNFYHNDSTYTILDFKYNDQNPMLSAIVVFKREDETDESNILITTTVGVGVLNVGGGVYNFQYLAENGITLISEDTIALSFRDRENSHIYDYNIKCTLNGENNVSFKVSSEIR